MDVTDVIAMLRQRADELGGEDALATAAGVSRQFVNMVLRNQRKPTPKLLDVINVEFITAYRKKGAKSS